MKINWIERGVHTAPSYKEIMSAVKIALQQNQNRGKRKKTDMMSADVSPDSKCPICLDIFNNISYLDLCLHKFCFRCIHEWSKNKAECPLCKQPFNSIYHSIKSEQDFKKYDLKPTDNGSFGTFGGVRFRYRTTLTGVHRQMQRTTAPPENGVMFEASANQPPQRQDRYIRRIMTKLAAQRRAASEGRMVNNLREQEMINFRKELYRQGVRVRCVRDGGRSRDTSAEFYRRNPACLHRLVPWLKRELSVLYGAHGSLVNIVQHIVMSRITRYDVEDGAMQEELRPFLQGCTEHFLHEFINFAKSPFNMEAYDQHAIYDCPGPSSTDDNSSNSSVIAISEEEEDHSVELDPPGDSSSINLSNSFWDDETPGPSYSSTRTEPSRIKQLSLPDSDADSSLEGETASPLNLSPLNQKASTQDNDSFNSDSEDCIIVGFVKATAERTPELVQLSSDSSDDSAIEDDKEVPHLPQHIRFTSVSPTVSQTSDQSGAGQSEKTDGIHRPDSKEKHRASSCGKHKTHRKNGDKDSLKESHRSRNKDHKRRRRSRSGEHRHPVTSYSREKSRSYSSRDDSYYKRRDSHLSHKTFSHSNYAHSGSYYYLERDNRQYASYDKFSSWRSYFQSRSRSRESRRHDRGRSQSRTYSSSRSPSVKRKSHHEKPGGKRKYKTRHLEEPYDGAEKDSSKHKKKDKERHHKKSKEEPRKSSRSLSVELVNMESSPERSKRHRKKKKKHKKKSKRHKSNERREKCPCSPAVITIDTDSDNGVDNRVIQASNFNMDNSPNKATHDPAEPDSLNISS